MYKILLMLALFLWPTLTRAELRIDVSGAHSQPMPIAIPYFDNQSLDTDLGQKITDVITDDLERSGLFRLVNRDAYIQQLNSIDTRPIFSDWQAIKANALVQGQIRQNPDGNIVVSFRLWDVFSQTQMAAKSLTTTESTWRRVAHIIADNIYERITGETGYFDSSIVFISESGNQKKRVKRLAVMDQDGANLRYLTDGENMVLTPRFSPNMKQVTYLSYQNGKPQVYLMDIESGNSQLIGSFPGMTFAPRFSPDGQTLIMSMARNGNSDIFLFDLKTRQQKQITNHLAIDTSPSFSPDGKRIVFNSDRGGSSQLYTMNADGSSVKRISFGKGTYSTPVWSPRGDYIAFTNIRDGQFNIGIMKPDGSNERLIATGWLVEAPTWAPNGRVLMFFRQTPSDDWGNKGTSLLYSIDMTGHNELQIPTPQDASDPTWSPLLH